MTLAEWQEKAQHGTSGDMVHRILADWAEENEMWEAMKEGVQIRITNLEESLWLEQRESATLREQLAMRS